MRKLTAILLGAAILFTGAAPVRAGGTAVQRTPPAAATAYLTDRDGNTQRIAGQLVEGPTGGGQAGEQTYAFLLELRGPGEASSTQSFEDDYGASRVYLHLTYKNTGSSYLLTSVSGYYELQDSGVEVTSTALRYACAGTDTVQTGVQRPSGAFCYATAFTEAVAGQGYVGATWTLNYYTDPEHHWSYTCEMRLLDTMSPPW
ncbi:hypothetical protein [Neobittarella massiliensis]|uniref:hypothetical protein n=1 Tax=Neobittarella massiliensis (ex Bilen et al. 2018) TaxID=2041842 RepID=UPI000CF6EE2F|nr:hypothetical protein [Neobittarella massiliensis]